MLDFLSENGDNRSDPEEHPSPETLTAYQANELSSDEDERIQSHLAVCAHCTELLLDLDEFLKPPAAAAEPVADFEAAADWQRLRKELRPDVEERAPTRPARRRFLASVWGGYSVAAALLVTTVGFGIWNAELLQDRRKPQPIFTVQTLSAQGSTRGGSGLEKGEPVVLPADITLLLPTEKPASLYRVDILRNESRNPEWSLDLPPGKGAELNFNLPSEALSPGIYAVQVAPLREGRPGPAMWRYRLQIAPPMHCVVGPAFVKDKIGACLLLPISGGSRRASTVSPRAPMGI